MYTPLYVKSNYSFMMSLVKIDSLIQSAVDNNLKAIALVDDNMIATMYFYKKCLANGIKPIIGLELKYKEGSILLYAENYNGYQNLLKISSYENKEELLRKYKDNLIVVIPFNNREYYNEIKEITNKLYIAFSNKEEESLALKDSSRVVFMNKVLYLSKEESKYYKYAIMMREKKNVFDDIRYEDDNNYLLPTDKVRTLSSNSGIETTNFIENSCNVTLEFNHNLIPEFYNKLGAPSSVYLKNLSIKGLQIRLGDKLDEKYKDRLLKELEIIENMGFSDYFLIVYDYIKYAKKQGILVGPGRGSSGGSLVAYALGIIEIDPLEYDLLFERFLNPGRVTMPDIDVDFADIHREKVIDYVKEKYGSDKVAGIIAIGTLKAKACLDDVSKTLKIDPDKVNLLKKYVSLNSKLSELYKKEEFKNIIDNDDRLKLLFEISSYFEGFPKNISTHASGVIISKSALDEIIPLVVQDGNYISSYEMAFLEELGLLKMDFLGNRNLTIIMEVIENLRVNEKIEIDFDNIVLDDQQTLRLFYNAQTNGIFQFESDIMKTLLQRLKPSSFSDIVAANALVRPGPDTNSYIDNKNKNLKVDYPSKDLEKILDNTYGVMVYQEQIMQIANKMAGFSLSEADILRRAMSKKDKNLLQIQEKRFIEGAIKNKYSYETSKRVYDDILAFSEYGFPKAHAVAYALIAYKMGYLKVHYSKYFYLSLLQNLVGNDYKTVQIIREARARGVKFYLPNINISTHKYELYDEGLIFPLSNIKNVGINTSVEITKIRKKEFTTIFDAFTKLTEIGVNKKNIESLIYASCFDIFNYNKKTLIENLDTLLNYAFLAKGLDSDNLLLPAIDIKEEYSKDILMQKEKELFGFYLSYHPTIKFKEQYKVVSLIDVSKHIDKMIDTIIMVDRIKEIKDKKDNKMAFISGSDEITDIEYICFSRVYQEMETVNKGDVLLIRGRVSDKQEIKIIVEKVKILK